MLLQCYQVTINVVVLRGARQPDVDNVEKPSVGC